MFFPGSGGGLGVNPLRNMMEPFQRGAPRSSPPPKCGAGDGAAEIYESPGSSPLI